MVPRKTGTVAGGQMGLHGGPGIRLLRGTETIPICRIADSDHRVDLGAEITLTEGRVIFTTVNITLTELFSSY